MCKNINSNLKKYFFIFLLLNLTFACKNNKENPLPEEIEKDQISTEIDSISKNTFEKILTLQNISFEITTTIESDSIKLNIQPSGLELDNQKIVLDIDAPVIDAEIEDLNADGFPEIAIYTTSSGSGSYGNVIGFSVNNGKSVSQIYMPNLTENKTASKGYMGHDEFTIVENSLCRKFPIYNDNDTNANPTGGTRQIEYKLKDGEASRIWVIEKISDIK